MNSSSAYLNPYFIAISGFKGKQSYIAMKECRLSLRNSAQACPP
jgi:hypothetical protein